METKPNAGAVVAARDHPAAGVLCLQAAGFAAAIALGLATTGYDHWDTWSFVVIAAMTVVSDLSAVAATTRPRSHLRELSRDRPRRSSARRGARCSDRHADDFDRLV